MAWPSKDHCHVPLLALASSTTSTGSAIEAHKCMAKPLSPKRRYPSAVARAPEQRSPPKAGFHAS